MGVYRTDYVVFGWKLPFKMKYEVDGKFINFWDEEFIPYIEGRKDAKYILIPDGMGGDYNVFGILVTMDSGHESGWNFVELKDITFKKEELISEYVRLFAPVSPPPDPKLFIFSHFF